MFRERKGTNNNQLTHGIICPQHKFNQLGLGVAHLATNVFKTKKTQARSFTHNDDVVQTDGYEIDIKKLSKYMQMRTVVEIKEAGQNNVKKVV